MTRAQSNDLPALLEAVIRARSDVKVARHQRPSPGSSAAAAEQQLLLAALETYAAALAQHGSPLPHRLRNELAMYRAMFSVRRGRGAAQ